LNKELMMKSVTHTLQLLAYLGLIGLAESGGVAAQAPKEQAQTPALAAPPVQLPPLIPLNVQVVVSRYQGEKKVSSLPYTLAVNANASRQGTPGSTVSSLRMGVEVPLSTTPLPPSDGKSLAAAGIQYRPFGTNIDAWANSIDTNRFQVNVSIEDSSIYTTEQAASASPKASDMPVFRSYRYKNELVLRDGQSAQFTAATDRVTGEVIKVDVTLSVLK
jgi:hypothetical protein